MLELRGELDLVSAPVLREAVESPALDAADALVLDLRELQFIDSSGLRAILSAYERAQQRGQEFALTRGSQQVQRLLDIAGTGEHLRIVASPDEILV